MSSTMKLTWDEFKQRIIIDKSLNFQEKISGNNYELWSCEANTTYICYIEYGTNDSSDYDTNYRSLANKSQFFRTKSTLCDGTDEITFVEDEESIKRIPVDAFISGVPSSGLNLSNRYRPKTFNNVTSINVSSSWTELVNVDGNGQIDFIHLRFESKDNEVQLLVDGDIIYTMKLVDLSDIHQLDNKLDFLSTTSSNEFSDKYPTPVDFTTNFTIKARNIKPETKRVFGRLVRYRVIV